MTAENLIPANPVSLADQEALQAFYNPVGSMAGAEEHATLRRLDAIAEELDFTDTPYWVHTNRGFSIPASFEANEGASIINFFKLVFEGTFISYAKLAMGRIEGVDNNGVEALCLAFNDATLLPYFDPIPEEHLLYVPVLAVDEIDPIDITA